MKKLALIIGLCASLVTLPTVAEPIGGFKRPSSQSFDLNLPVRDEMRWNGTAVTGDGAPIKVKLIIVYKTTLRSSGLRTESAINEAVETAFTRVTKNSTVPEIKADSQKFVNRFIYVSEHELRQKIRGVAGIEEFNKLVLSDNK